VSVGFSLQELAIPQDFHGEAVRQVITVIPVGKPNSQEFFRAHPQHGQAFLVYEDRIDRATYVVRPELAAAAGPDAKPRLVVPVVTRQGVLRLVAARLPAADGRTDGWMTSMLEAVRLAKDSWIRIEASMPGGYYVVHQAVGDLGSPAWPDITFSEMVEIAFRGRIIDAFDHPVLRRARGEV